MSLLWTVVSTLAVLVLTVLVFVVFEVTIRPGSMQRQQIAKVVWPVAGLLVVALWSYYLAMKKRPIRDGQRDTREL